ncbi:cytochrome P450 [Mycena galericulata]|nr:cytochrome P450 [Mycena galericulata]
MSRLFILIAVAAVWLTKVIVEKSLSLRSASRISRVPHSGILWLHPFRSPAILLGRWFPLPHQVGSWYAGFAPYVKYGSTCVGSTLLSGSLPTVWLADADAIKTVAGEPTVFQKDVEAYESLNFYGDNLVGTEGADWRRHRKVANPAFNEVGNAFVWVETVRVAHEWFAELDAAQAKQGGGPITVDAGKDLFQAALLVISSAGFGRRASWQEDSSAMPPAGHTMAFRTAVFSVVHHLFTAVLTPEWLYALSERVYIPYIGSLVRDTNAAYAALKMHMLDLISLSRAWVVEGKVSNMEAGLLRNLVEANMSMQDEDVGDGAAHSHKSLTEDELLSNTFNFLLAGHETTAHSLTFAVGLLALYPNVQRKIYDEALKFWPSGPAAIASPSTYKESMPNLQYTLATFHETIRLFPAVIRLAKLVHADASVKTHCFSLNAQGDVENIREFPFSLTAGSMVMIDIRGLHLNPMYWGRDAHDFKPERFIDTDSYRWPRDAFVAFSAGPRNCIGQRFALTESVCMLAHLVRNYEISLPDNLRVLPFEEQKRTLLNWVPGVTMTPTNCFVRLQRRT